MVIIIFQDRPVVKKKKKKKRKEENAYSYSGKTLELGFIDLRTFFSIVNSQNT